jgi:hypothetical protein
MTIKDIIFRNDDILEFMCNDRTKFPIYLVGGFSMPLNEELCEVNKIDPLQGSDHVGMVGKGHLEKEDVNKWYLRHAHPPYVTSNELTEEYWREILKEHDITIWRFQESFKITDEDRVMVINESCKIAQFKWDDKQKFYRGVPYNWPAVILSPVTWFFSWFGLRFAVKSIAKHCAEYTFKSHLPIKEVLSPAGPLDPCVSPNEIINSGLLYRVYTVKLVDNNIMVEA